ncbi:MAG: hypothetical protein OHK0053_12010 [Microscillaceae bacterium]
MENPKFVNDARPENPAQDFEFLRSQGLQFIQELGGAFWTDYNDHDPGITILEQLCYALTDLAYRTDLPIQDHLAGQSAAQKPFFLPHQILPCQPLTLLDYRKCLLDAIASLRNVWILPLSPEEHSLAGLYKILIDADDRIEKPDDQAKLVEAVRAVFHQNRNLGEDLEEVVVLEPIFLSLYADIEISQPDQIEAILAQIFFQINEYLHPEVQFYSLAERMAEGYALTEIFEGPLLKHGFIKNETLNPKLDRVLVSELIKIVMQVPGVVSVKNVHLRQLDEIYDNQFTIPTHQKPRLLLGSRPGREDLTINFFKDNVYYDQIDKVLFRRKLNELNAGQKRVYRVQDPSTPLPLGREMAVETYYSIQNQFPLVYGIGEFGVPERANKARKAQAAQLKGYLLLFEQFLADYLAQLAHIKTLFSPQPEASQSYFCQSLSHLPQVSPLLQKQAQVSFHDSLLPHSLPLDYEKGLYLLTALPDHYGQRRNRLLDFLLAIHGEIQLQYSATQKNFYFSEEEFVQIAIRNKTLFFRYLPLLGAKRGQAANIYQPDEAPLNLSGLEMKLRLLLGLYLPENPYAPGQLSPTRSLTQAFQEVGWEIVLSEKSSEWQTQTTLARFGLEEEDIHQTFDYLDPDDLANLPLAEAPQASSPVFALSPPMYFLREGLDWKNFRLGRRPDKEEWYLVFYASAAESWHVLGQFSRDEDGKTALAQLWQSLKWLNQQSEGFFLVEHVLLRPSLSEHCYGFFLVDATGRPVLRSRQRLDFQTRQEQVATLKPYLYEYENYAVERRPDGDFEIHFKSPDGKIDFVSLRAYESVQEIHEQMEALYNFLADKTSLTDFEKKIKFFVQPDSSGMVIPESFFSGRVSLLLPDWTRRFHNNEFRSVIDGLVVENQPAHTQVQTHWLSPQAMLDLEKHYHAWRKQQIEGQAQDAARALLYWLATQSIFTTER